MAADFVFGCGHHPGHDGQKANRFTALLHHGTVLKNNDPDMYFNARIESVVNETFMNLFDV